MSLISWEQNNKTNKYEFSLISRTCRECPCREAVGVRVIVGRLQGEQRGPQDLSRTVLSLVVPHQHLHRHLFRCRGRRHQVGGHLAAFCLIPAVLEPDLDLSLCELQGGRQVRPLRPGQVPLVVEAALQLEDLRMREGGPGALLALLGLVQALVIQRAGVWERGTRRCSVRVSPCVCLFVCLFGSFRAAAF